MVLPENQEIALTVGLVSASGAGKTTLANKLHDFFQFMGAEVLIENVGDFFRNESKKLDMPFDQFLAEHTPEELDEIADAQTIDYLKRSIGIGEWLARYGSSPPLVLILPGRLDSLLADIATYSGDLTQYGYFGIGLTRPDWIGAMRVTESKGLPLSEDNILKTYDYLQRKDSEDFRRFARRYGITSMDDLWSKEINDVVFDTEFINPDLEMWITIGTLLQKKLLPFAWHEQISNFTRDLAHVLLDQAAGGEGGGAEAQTRRIPGLT